VAVGLGPEFTLTACDWRTPLAIIDTYESCTVIARYNAVSTWELVLPTNTDAAQALLTAAQPRLLIDADGVFRSGPATRLQRTVTMEGDLLTINGVDDLAFLANRLAHPQPGTASPPYSSTAADTRVGIASTLIAGFVDRNAGPGAIAARRVPDLTVPTPAVLGGNVRMNGAWQNLLDFIVLTAKSQGFGVRVRDLEFQVYQPTGQATFSIELGTLASWQSVLEMPTANFVYVGGAGVGTARVYQQAGKGTSIAKWGRIEQFNDQRTSSVPVDLLQSALDSLADLDRPPSVEMGVLDTPQQMFLRDWNVGDTATVVIGDETLHDVIVEAEIKLLPNEPPSVKPVLGAAPVELTTTRQLRDARRRIVQIEAAWI